MVLRECGRLAWGGRAARFAAEPPTHAHTPDMDSVCVCDNRQTGSPTQGEERGWWWAHHSEGESRRKGVSAIGGEADQVVGKSELPLALGVFSLLVPRLAASLTLPSRS